eukprot:TRINITY_DN26218_c0_g1_i1.p1 TRINITY_DN26218_c0_g1~~TRINITY_DN26218_c0_g1_i1.p1  ORF type:complete len:226 (-),score=58.27 TRINITY_DN26218_c0_g1_i1:1130-1807(-)
MEDLSIDVSREGAADVLTDDLEIDLGPGLVSNDGLRASTPQSEAKGKGAVNKILQGDYLRLSANHAILKYLSKQGDYSLYFADTIIKMNSSMHLKKQLLVVTGKALYLFHSSTFHCKRRIPLASIVALYLSELSDNFLAADLDGENSFLLASTRKTEIVTVVLEASKKQLDIEVNVVFTNVFTVKFNPQVTCELRFEQEERGVLTLLRVVEESIEEGDRAEQHLT